MELSYTTTQPINLVGLHILLDNMKTLRFFSIILQEKVRPIREWYIFG